MVVAGLCIIHCFLFPFLVILLPASKNFFASPVTEAVILVLGVIIGSISFTTSYRKHRKPYPMMVGLTGVALLSLSLFVFSHETFEYHLFNLPVDPVMIVGGLLLIAGHAWNLHACHCFCDQSCAHEEHQHAHSH